ncbi:MAG: glycosyltransferase family 4 protein [Anaerolineales bacterium]|nr:glycosyltransferase family 4 protein [Anaerolineales bacterium]
MIIGIDASRATAVQRTGTEAYAWQLIQALLPPTAVGGHELRLYVNQPPPENWLPPAPHVTIRAIPFPRLWTHLRLAAELHQHPPDVFFTPAHVIPATYFGASVATVHDLGYHYFPSAHTRQQVAYLRWSTRHNARRSRLVLADSQATKDDLCRFDHINPDKIRVVYPAVDPQLARDLAEPPSLPAGISPPYLLFLSTLQPRKNVVRLLEAFTAVAEQIPHQLVLAGKLGWQSEPIRAALDELPTAVRARVLLPGFVPDMQKAHLIAGADALLYPSLHEGFGFPLLEGNVCGTAVLASNSSSLPELAGEGAALLVDPLDTAAIATAVRRLATDETLRQSLVQRGYENVRRFSWANTAVQTLAILEEAATRQAK